MPTRKPDEIRVEIERTRDELATNLDRLRKHLDGVTDWHRWMDENPLAFLGGAFALGLYAGLRS